MYTDRNFRTKKALKAAFKDGQRITVFRSGPFAISDPTNGVVYLEGPHSPRPRKWYASAEVEDNVVTKIIS